MYPLMLSYNTSIHNSIHSTMFFFTFGMEAHQPALSRPKLLWQFYRDSTTDDLIKRLLQAWSVIHRNNQEATTHITDNANKNSQLHRFQSDQLVLLDKHSFIHKNQTLVPKWHRLHKVRHYKKDITCKLSQTQQTKTAGKCQTLDTTNLHLSQNPNSSKLTP